MEVKINKKFTLGDDALHTDRAAQQSGGQGSRGDVLGPEAALQADEEFLMLLGIGGIHRGHHVFQRPLERKQLLETPAHQSDKDNLGHKLNNGFYSSG